MSGFKTLSTADDTTSFRKVLVYGAAGVGKTTQAARFKEHYGKGLILSGEAGLSSIRSSAIAYLPFTSFDGPHDPAANVFSFIGICRMMQSPEFKAEGFKWLMLDSMTELSDMVMAWATAKAERKAAETGKPVNNFDKYGDYNDKMMGAARFLRDLPMHVIISALSQESENEATGEKEITPLIQGGKAKAQIPGIFDAVLGLVARHTKATKDAPASTARYVITGPSGGWRCKVRDEHGVVDAVMETGSIVDVLKLIEAADARGGK